MDLNDLWQEHKRFILGVATGAVLFFVAYSWISAEFDTTSLERSIRSYRASLSGTRRFGRKALQVLDKRVRELLARLERDKSLVEFRIRPEFDVSKKTYPERDYARLAAKVQEEIRNECELNNVTLDPRKGAARVGLPPSSPLDKESIQRTLLGLDLAERTLKLWLDAGREVMGLPGRRALGLISIDRVAIDIGSGAGFRRRALRKQGPELDVVRVRVRLTCGSYTVRRFLEKSQAGASPLQVESFKVSSPAKGGSALTVDAVFLAPRLKEVG